MSLACASRSLRRGEGGDLSGSCRDQVSAAQDTLCPVGCGSLAVGTATENRIIILMI